MSLDYDMIKGENKKLHEENVKLRKKFKYAGLRKSLGLS